MDIINYKNVNIDKENVEITLLKKSEQIYLIDKKIKYKCLFLFVFYLEIQLKYHFIIIKDKNYILMIIKIFSEN